MQIDKDRFVDILQARRELKIAGTADNKHKVISMLKKKVLKYAQDNNIEHYLIPHDSNISKPAQLYIPKEYVSVFLKANNVKYKSSKIGKYESLTMNTTGKSFRETLQELGVNYRCFRHRLKAGWTFARAITTPHRDLLETEYRDKIKRELDRFMTHKRKMKYRQF